MTENQTFSMTRFTTYLHKLVTERWPRLSTASLILLGLLVVIELWIAATSYGSISTSDEDPAATTILISCGMLFLVGGCVSASRMFTDGMHKAGRIHVLTTPVSPLESWLARWMIYVLGYVVVFFCCFLVAETLRFILFSAFDYVSYAPIFDPDETPVAWWCGYVFLTSWFALGCYFFPRWPLLGTGICVFIIGLLFVMTMVFMSGLWTGISSRSEHTLEIMSYLWLVLHGVFNWWLSYRRLSEMEVIDHH